MIRDIVKQLQPLPSKSKMIIFGGGFSGQHVAKVLRSLGNTALCSRRTKDSKGADFLFDSDLKEMHSLNKTLDDATHLLSCIPPLKNGQDPVLTCLKQELQSRNLKWVGYLSTTGVYGDSQGRWVNEENHPKPQQERSIRRLSCEQEWTNSGLPVQILRLPGIYGPGRSAIENLKKGKPKMIDKANQVFSRIHIDDIAGAIIFLINLASKGKIPPIVNISDDCPSNNIEVLTYAAKLINYSLPNTESFQSAAKTMSPMALSFWQENRRISNKLLCKDLGYSLIHPDYKSGLKDCLSHINDQTQ